MSELQGYGWMFMYVGKTAEVAGWHPAFVVTCYAIAGGLFVAHLWRRYGKGVTSGH